MSFAYFRDPSSDRFPVGGATTSAAVRITLGRESDGGLLVFPLLLSSHTGASAAADTLTHEASHNSLLIARAPPSSYGRPSVVVDSLLG